MKKYCLVNISAVSFVFVFSASCSYKEPPKSNSIKLPPVVNTSAVFSKPCKKIIYSSNESDRFRVYWIDFDDNTMRPSTKDSIFEWTDDLFASDISCDCQKLALVSDTGGDQVFDVLLYDFAARKISRVTTTDRIDEGNASFSPTEALLAFLSAKRLVVYDYLQNIKFDISRSPRSFSSLTWGSDGKTVFLEDLDTNIWRFSIEKNEFSIIWSAPKICYSSRTLSSFGNELYFISDHESDFTQVYCLNLATQELRRILPANHDQYSPITYDGIELFFRTNINGNFVVTRLSNGVSEYISPPNGVVYDFTFENPMSAILYASERHIASVYLCEEESDSISNVAFQSLLEPRQRGIQTRNEDGMINLIYLPKMKPTKWLVWLHGGPNEQVSPRFNPYFHYLLEFGYGLVVLNYRGSTGIGNLYELRGSSRDEQIKIQIHSIERDLKSISKTYRIDSFALIGVSYGSILAHLYAVRHPTQVSHLIDFSGIADDNDLPVLSEDEMQFPPVLFIGGLNDLAMKNSSRRKLMRRYAATTDVKDLFLENEGHVIRHKSSMIQIIQAIREFLDTTVN